MATDSKYNLDEFRKLVLSGSTKAEIMKIMDIKGYPQFSSLELKLFKTDRKVYDIATTQTNEIVPKNIKIGTRGNITIPKHLLENFNTNDEFSISIKNKKITLTLIEKEGGSE